MTTPQAGETYRASADVKITEVLDDGEVRGTVGGLPFFTTAPQDWDWQPVPVTWPDPSARPSVLNDRTPDIDRAALYEKARDLYDETVRVNIEHCKRIPGSNAADQHNHLPNQALMHERTLEIAQFLAGDPA